MSAEQIFADLYRVVVPLPGNPLKEINSYILLGDDEFLVVDTGMNRPECHEVLTAGLAEIGVDLDRTDFLATHLHADHHGLIPELLRPGRRASMGRGDAETMRRPFSGFSTDSPMGQYLHRSGFPPAELEATLANHPAMKFTSRVRQAYDPLDEGDRIRIGDFDLEVIDTPGHTFGHISLYDRQRRLFIAGDHVLGDITPNIQAWSDDHDPLKLFLDSLTKVEQLDVELCLPGHRSLITDFGGRIEELRSHHAERAQEVVEILERQSPRSSYDVAAEMSWDIRARSWDDFPAMQRWFATGEAIAHTRYLEEQGRIGRVDEGERILYEVAAA